jgi:tetratricopeptide (TPR) repeat protein
MDRDERLRRAEKLASSGRLEAAAAEYEAIVAADPRDLATANALGDLYVRAGLPDRARSHYEHVADAYAREGFFARAAGFYKKLLKLAPGEAVVLAKLGEVIARQGLVVEAVAHFRALARLLESRGDAPGVAEVMARIERLAHDRPAGPDPRAQVGAPVRESAAAGSPAETSATTRLALARTYVAAGLVAEARPLLEALHADDPSDVDAAALLADLHEREGDAGRAIACLEGVVSAHREPSQARVAALRRLGDALERAGQRARALSVWRDALVLVPGDRELNERLARVTAAMTPGGGPSTR